MTLSKLFDRYAGKLVLVEMTDGEVIQGILSCHISAEDNDPEPECIVVGNIELPADEIKRIEPNG